MSYKCFVTEPDKNLLKPGTVPFVINKAYEKKKKKRHSFVNYVLAVRGVKNFF